VCLRVHYFVHWPEQHARSLIYTHTGIVRNTYKIRVYDHRQMSVCLWQALLRIVCKGGFHLSVSPLPVYCLVNLSNNDALLFHSVLYRFMSPGFKVRFLIVIENLFRAAFPNFFLYLYRPIHYKYRVLI